MKKIKGFMLYILIMGMLFISTLVLVLIKNSSLNRNIENYYDVEYKRYLLSYRELLKSVDEDREKWISIYNEKFLDKNFNYERTVNINLNEKLKILSFKNHSFHINILNMGNTKDSIFSEAIVSYLPISILESNSLLNLNDCDDISNDFIKKIKSGEELPFTVDGFKYENFNNSEFEVVVDTDKIRVVNMKDKGNVKEYINDSYLYLNFVDSTVSIKCIGNSSFYGILQSNYELNTKGLFNLAGTIISSGIFNNDKIESRGMILYENISNTNIIKTKEKNIRQINKIDDLITLDITSFI